MKLKSQLIISISILGAIFLIIFSSYIITNQQVSQLNNQEQVALNIQTGASDLNYLTTDFFLFQQSEQVTLFQSKISSLSNDLSKLNSNDPTQATLINNTKNDLQRLDSVFDDAVLFLENAPRNVSVRVLPAFQTAWSRLAVQSQTLTYDSVQLSQTIRDQSDQLKQTNSLLVFSMVGAFGVYFVTIYFLVFRRTFRSIAKLQDGTKIIGSGNLDYSIAAKSNDEVGDLSRAFNQMTTNLKTVTASKKDLEQARNSLRVSEQRWATTLSSIGDSVIATDVSGSVTFMNAVAEELTGWTLRESLGKPLKDVFHIINEETRLEVESPVTKVLEKGMIIGLANHTILVRKDGLEVPLDDSGAPIKDEKGKVTGVVLVFHDITERKKAEEALNESEAQLRAYVASSSDAVYRMNADWSEMCQLRGQDFIPDTDEPDRSWLEKYIHPDDHQHVKAAIKRAIETKSIFELEHRVIQVDGTLGWTFSRAIPLLDKDGKIVEWFGTAKDVTERKKIDAALEYANGLAIQERDRLSSLLNSITDEVWFADTEKKFTLANPSAIKEFKLKPTDQGVDVENLAATLEVYRPDGTLRPVEEAPPLRALKGEILKNQEEIVRTPTSGDLRHRLVSSAPVRGKEGNIIGSVSVVRDITDLKQLQNRLQKYTEDLEKLVEERTKQLKDSERLATIGATAGMVGHDIRNPLQAITGDLYLAKTDLASIPESEEKQSIQESLTAIENNIDYIAKIVQDLQDYARPLTPKPEEADLKLIITKLFAKNNMPDNIELSVKVENSAEKISTDSHFINRIMFNLINNAVQAMPNGGKLTIHAFRGLKDLVMTVKDTGVGIPKEIQGKMFTAMFTTKAKGQGFGLPVVKRMTESLGGTVSFESQEGKGTTFTVRLPLTR
jgi:PAS domain S-box-containing protein